jgi:hypothetical protein
MVVKESVNKSNRPIQNNLLLVTELRTHGNIEPALKNQPRDDVLGYSRCLFSEPHETLKKTVWVK